jgi:type III pantothenate kinase
MLAAVDLGNTSLKIGAFRDGALVSVERIGLGRTLAEDVIPTPPLFGADEVVVLSSSPRRLAEFRAWCPRTFRLLGDEVRAALPTTYGRASELGLDRLAAALGARRRVGPGRIVVLQAGTAITADGIGPHRTGVNGNGVNGNGGNGDSRHVRPGEPGHPGAPACPDRLVAIGIAPGLRAAADGLHAAAPHLPFPDLSPGVPVLPSRGTADSLRAGHLLAAAGALERLADATADALGGADACVLTGGAAELLAPLVRRALRVEPDLTLLGIAALHEAVPA